MNKTLMVSLLAAAAFVPMASAQKWELGGAAGLGYYTSRNVTGSASSGSVKITPGVAASGWVANSNAKKWGGELRYDFQMGDLKVWAQSGSATFKSISHAVHYDLLFHTAPVNAKVRPFAAFGGGMKIYQGTGKEVAAQPLNSLALLTKTSDLRALISAGAGVKFNFKRLGLRLEVHDYVTPFPVKVIAPAPNAKIGGFIHDLVFDLGISMLK
jgi:hypothetical protein